MVRKITTTRIIELYLNDYSRKYYLREMASLLKKPHQSIKPHIEELIKEGILIKNERTNLVEYSLNFKNKRLFDYLIIAEKEKTISRLKEDVILNLLYEKLSAFFNNNYFIVFGSASEKIKKGSDIDLLIIGKSNVNKILGELEEVYNKKIHKLQVNSLNKLNEVLIKEIYKKHLIFNNTEQIVRFFGGLYEKNKLV